MHLLVNGERSDSPLLLSKLSLILILTLILLRIMHLRMLIMVLLRQHMLSLLWIHSLWLRPSQGQILLGGRRLLRRTLMILLPIVAGSIANSLQMPRPLDADGCL